MPWYTFEGTDSLNPTHYRVRAKAPGCKGKRTICAIYCPGDNYPYIDYDLICHMVLALSKGENNDLVCLRD